MFKIKTKPRNLMRYESYYRRYKERLEDYTCIGIVLCIALFIAAVILIKNKVI